MSDLSEDPQGFFSDEEMEIASSEEGTKHTDHTPLKSNKNEGHTKEQPPCKRRIVHVQGSKDRQLQEYNSVYASWKAEMCRGEIRIILPDYFFQRKKANRVVKFFRNLRERAQAGVDMLNFTYNMGLLNLIKWKVARDIKKEMRQASKYKDKESPQI